jgi:hypothetical protein
MSELLIAFRASPIFPSGGDPVGVTYCVADAYLTTRGGYPFGWSAGNSVAGRDRDASLGNHSGMNFTGVAGDYFQIDLPGTGSTAIHAAFGDASSDNCVNWTFKDTTTTIASVSGDVFGGTFTDASNVNRASAAAWNSDEVPITYTASTTALRIYANAPSGGRNNVIAFLRVVQGGGGGGGGGIFLPQLERGIRGLNRGLATGIN